MPDGYTDAQLSDGTTLRFQGELAPDQVKAKVAAYRAKSGQPPSVGGNQAPLSQQAQQALTEGYSKQSSPLRAVMPSARDVVSSAKDFGGDLVNTGKGMYHMATDEPSTTGDKVAYYGTGPLGLFAKRALGAQYDSSVDAQKFAKEYADKGDTAGSMIESASAALPIVGPLIHGAYGQSPGLGASRLLQAGLMKSAPEQIKNMEGASRIVNRQLAVNEGQVRVVNDMVKQPLKILEAKVKEEIGKQVDSVLTNDATDMRNRGMNPDGNTGLVNTSKAAERATEAAKQRGADLAKSSDSLLQEASLGSSTLKAAKELTTKVGKESARLSRSGDLRGAAVMNELYDGLHDATAERAQALGSDSAKSWQKYIDITRSYKGLDSGLMGEVMDEPVHSEALGKLVNAAKSVTNGRQVEIGQIKQAMKDYGVNPETFDKAISHGESLINLATENKANFMGKIKAIIKRPGTAGVAALGAGVVGSAIGGHIGGLLLPLIVAGRVAKLMDNVELAGVLKEINEQTNPSLAKEQVPKPSDVASPIAEVEAKPAPQQSRVDVADVISALKNQGFKAADASKAAASAVKNNPTDLSAAIKEALGGKR